MDNFPKISIITPSYNQGAYLEATIRSVLDQGYPNLEYGIIDGGSTDDSWSIINKYKDRLLFGEQGPDEGMYAAINRGHARTSGQIMGWLNSDDLLHPGSLFTLAQIFTSLPQVRWLTGCRTAFSESGLCIAAEPAESWSAERIALGRYQWIQQESTYWARTLWEDTGARLEPAYALAGDFELWHRFFGQAQLYSTDALIGGFRSRSKNQASLDRFASYEEQVLQIISRPISPDVTDRVDQIRKREGWLRKLKGVAKDTIRARYIEPLYSAPPRIYFDRLEQAFKLKTTD